MDGDSDSYQSNSIDWNTEDELEIESTPLSSDLGSRIPGQDAFPGTGEASCSHSPTSLVIQCFLDMGFPEEMVVRAANQSGAKSTEAILEELLKFSQSSVCSVGEGGTLADLLEMGFNAEEALIAIEKCGPNTPIGELLHFILAARMATKEADFHPREQTRERGESSSQRKQPNAYILEGKRRLESEEDLRGKRLKGIEKKGKGFGVPGDPSSIVPRTLPRAAKGLPFFYYENVENTVKGEDVWSTISRFLYDIMPEFVDSKYFCSTSRKRGYVHNLPIEGRFQVLPVAPLTVQEALPVTEAWWPSWDTRSQLNCLNSHPGSATLSRKIMEALEKSVGDPPNDVKKYVMVQCKKCNLVWTGPNTAVSLEPAEMEILMGFPREHTRGFPRTEQYRALGNAFQVDTVGYHLSVLKNLFPAGINVLSLFSGIGGAEVALYRLGIPLKNVVSVEQSKSYRLIVNRWWKQTKQDGNLIQEVTKVQQVTAGLIDAWSDSFGRFDLVIGGNRCRRGGQGEAELFHEFVRILDLVKMQHELAEDT